MKKLRIKNFQIHKDLEIEFGPITTIVGASDSGKSAILRALRWVAMNEPKGTGFIREGAKEASVTLILGGREIQRQRSASNNSYGMDGVEFKAFGNDVPEDIARVLNVSELNFQGQHDAPLWFTESAGEVSRRLNYIVDLSQIDSTLSAIDSIVREQRWLVQLSETKKAKIKEEGMALKWTNAASKEFEAITEKKEIWEKASQSVYKASELVGRIDSLQDSLKRLETPFTSAERAFSLGLSWQETREKRETLEDACEVIESAEKIISIAPPIISRVEKAIIGWSENSRAVKALENMVERIEGIEAQCEKEKSLKNLEEQYKKALGNVCPLCGQRIE